MVSLSLITVLTFGLIIYGLIEYQQHQKFIKKIPIRIHVNGTRGKSSVTRLIGAGLRAGGMKSVTKVTGTFPRLIMEEGEEVAIRRKEKANILEQLKIVRFAANRNIDALIIECMALQPRFQEITEHQMVHATVGVITNVRLDHLDVMGPKLSDIANALGKTIPKNSNFFTSEERSFEALKEIAEKRKTLAHQSLGDKVSDEEMKGFTYIEHKDNVALALDVCEHLGVDRKEALEAMKKMIPDEGVLIRHLVRYQENRIHFFNAFAANDPESSKMIWDSIFSTADEDEFKVVLLTTRVDRLDRAKQLVALIDQHLNYDFILFMGEAKEQVKDMVAKTEIQADRFHLSSATTAKEAYEEIEQFSRAKTTVVGIGNMGVIGADLAALINEKSENNIKS